MSDLVLTLSPEVSERLESLADKLGRSVEDCGHLALAEFLDNWEDYVRTVQALETDTEERPILRAVND